MEVSRARLQRQFTMIVPSTGRSSWQFQLVIVIEAVIRLPARQALLEKSSHIWVDDPPVSILRLLVNDVSMMNQ